MSARGISKFHRDQSGAVAPLLLFIMLFLVWATLGILNVSQDARVKVENQNAVDALSIAASDQAARDLNIMGLNHTAAAQTFTISVSSLALVQTYAQVGIKIGFAAADAATPSKCWPSRLPYGYLVCVAIAAYWGIEFGLLVSNYGKYQPHKGIKVGNRVISALDRMNKHIVSTHPKRVSRLVKALAQMNRVDAVLVFPTCDPANGSECSVEQNFPASSLPVDENTGVDEILGQMEMCQGIGSGSNGYTKLNFKHTGFSNGKGPLTEGGRDGGSAIKETVDSSFLDDLKTPEFDPEGDIDRETYDEQVEEFEEHADRIRDLDLTGFDNSSGDKDHLRNFINSKAGFSSRLPRIDTARMVTNVLVYYRDNAKFSNGQKSDDNKFLDIFDQTWSISCIQIGELKKTADAFMSDFVGAIAQVLGQFFLERPQTYRLKGIPQELRLSMVAVGSFGSLLAPLVDLNDFHYLYIAARDRGKRAAPVSFGFNEDPFYAYSQSMIFNKKSHELYSSLWTSDLVPASHMRNKNKLKQVVSKGQVSKHFRKFQQLLEGGISDEDWKSVTTR